MTSLTLTHHNLPGVTVIVVSGELDITNDTQLPAFLARVRRRPADQVVLDLTELTFMDSFGLRAVLICHADALARGGDARPAAPQHGPVQVLAVTGVDAHLTVHDTVKQALLVAMAAAESAI
ncbi:STAS domain-containing protein [Nonomuraea insulae]|uniref:STAS domain-containing protein n=1 Tax=Nonomuraea insulae TaxID=1616787 RepID=A0ABW1CEH3_9ACTN